LNARQRERCPRPLDVVAEYREAFGEAPPDLVPIATSLAHHLAYKARRISAGTKSWIEAGNGHC
jgi:hypothetical protein